VEERWRIIETTTCAREESPASGIVMNPVGMSEAELADWEGYVWNVR
jgi:hypothetical protein